MKEIIERFYVKELKVVVFVEKFIELMVILIGNLIIILDFDMIVFGGGLLNFDYIYEVLLKVLLLYLMCMVKVLVIKKVIYGDLGGICGVVVLFLK